MSALILKLFTEYILLCVYNLCLYMFRPKLHYTDTGYGHVVQHHQRTPPTDELTTILQQICHIAMPEPNISTCQYVGMWQIFVRWWRICCTTIFVVELLRARRQGCQPSRIFRDSPEFGRCVPCPERTAPFGTG